MSSTPGLLSPFVALVAALCAAAAFAQGPAQGYPNKPIRLIVPVAPGGGTDFTARLIGQKLNDAWGQPVIVDNRPGAAGNIGVEIAAKAVPDGYTLVIPITSFPINPSLYSSLPFDTVKDFSPVVLVTSAPLLLVVNPSLQAKSVSELIALAKAKPGQLNFANSGSGTTAHLAGELFKRMAGVDIVSVAYKGGGPAIIALVGGEVQMYFSTIPAALTQVKAGRLRALAVTSSKRVPQVADVPTVAESGLPGFEVVAWFGLFTPAGTPRPVVQKLNAEIVKILDAPDTRQRLSGDGLIPGGGKPEELGAFLKAEIAKWSKLIKEAGIRVN
jgi:tripartite-type tricarboxylate transporter receptor subunit TctC